MSQSVRRAPKLCIHRPSGRAYVFVDGKRVYLGSAGSAEANREYARVVERLTSCERPAQKFSATHGQDLTVSELVLLYMQHADAYYRKHGRPTSEAGNIRAALKSLRELLGSTPASEFTPAALEAVRDPRMSKAISQQ